MYITVLHSVLVMAARNASLFWEDVLPVAFSYAFRCSAVVLFDVSHVQNLKRVTCMLHMGC
jgi:hypothetical protein